MTGIKKVNLMKNQFFHLPQPHEEFLKIFHTVALVSSLESETLTSYFKMARPFFK